ncbi:hypothetical protein [Flavobacterium sp. ZE23DGlu08]|uniref:hypothetical protein n=1 Tax=Flavobacterium sp. ZE23DGlu08 TaxID=3059026 RepID=UPI00265E0146|nr:hypothetical protein [Flavobacterium sp. ZE23DGlu08]WKL43735.1 hypothetical protein Q1W72_15475 [Flavobacterium sp. ZE23DGlu08]
MKNNFINKIDNAIISQISEGDYSSYDSILIEQGYDLDLIESQSQKSFKKQAFILKGMMNKQKDMILLEKASNLLREAIEKNIDKPISYLKGLITNNQFQVQYRNLENLDIEEIKEIIKDQNLIELLEELENDKK